MPLLHMYSTLRSYLLLAKSPIFTIKKLGEGADARLHSITIRSENSARLCNYTSLTSYCEKNNFIQAVYIFCCGSSMYYFGYYVTLFNMDRLHKCSRFHTASGLGFTGTFLSAMTVVSVLVGERWASWKVGDMGKGLGCYQHRYEWGEGSMVL